MKYVRLFENFNHDGAVKYLEDLTGCHWTVEEKRPGGTSSFDEWRPNCAWLSNGDEVQAKMKLKEAGIETDYLSWVEGPVLCVDLNSINVKEDFSDERKGLYTEHELKEREDKERKKYATYKIVAVDPERKLKKLLEHIGASGNGGHSFTIVVDPELTQEEGGNYKLGWDGDGQDKIKSIEEIETTQEDIDKKSEKMKTDKK